MPRPSRWDDVVDAAARIFGEKGYAGASLEDVAEEVGMLKGSLYNYISSKEELLLAVVRSPANQLLSRAEAIRTSRVPASEKFRQIAENHVRTIDSHLDYVRVYVQEFAGRHEGGEWSELDRAYIKHIEAIILEGIEQGAFEPATDPRTAALALTGALNWMTRWYHPGSMVQAKAIANQMSDVFLAGLSVRGNESSG